MYAISAMAKKNCCEKCAYIANKKKQHHGCRKVYDGKT